MVTTRRNGEQGTTYDTTVNATAGVQVLERTLPKSYNEYVSAPEQREESVEETRARMQKNLDRILNYDRYSAENMSATTTVEDSMVAPEIEERAEAYESVQIQEEDIRPTSTTMQFGETNLEQIYDEMNKGKEDEKVSYKLNLKGKLVIAAYAALVAIIFALIILNTGVLTVLADANTTKAQTLSAMQEEYTSITAEIDSISSDEYIRDIAQNKYGMVFGNN